jgi:signal transduction histidine kinase
VEILEGCYKDNMRHALGQGVTLVLTPKEGLPDLMADSKLLTRVFNNIIGNAIKYTPVDGKVSISSKIGRNALQVTVTDTGIGIPPEDLERIFYKYYRSDGATGFKGTGLGLAITKTIIDAHGGNIEVESSIGAGSSFTISIPCSSPEENNLASS